MTPRTRHILAGLAMIAAIALFAASMPGFEG
jgi:hypothetical protein